MNDHTFFSAITTRNAIRKHRTWLGTALISLLGAASAAPAQVHDLAYTQAELDAAVDSLLDTELADAPREKAYSAASGYLQPQVTSYSADPYVNRCALNPPDDVGKLRQDPAYIQAYHSGSWWNSAWAPTTGRGLTHRQGIQRLLLNGRNYFVVSNSTESGTVPGIEVVAIESRDGYSAALGATATPSSRPATYDHVVRYHDIASPYFNHVGGIQISGAFAVLPWEASDDSSRAGFAVVDLRNPLLPAPVASVQRQRGEYTNAGAAAMTRLADGRFLALIFGNDSDDVEVFLSSQTGMPGQGSGSVWTSVSRSETPSGFEAYQNVQMITACDGRLFVAGTHKNIYSEDWLDLWQLKFTSALTPTFSKVANRQVKCSSGNTGSRRYCDFDAGAGVHVSPTGSVLLYGVEHYNDAYPYDGTTVKVREFTR